MPKVDDVYVSPDRRLGGWRTTRGSETIARLATQAAAYAIGEREARHWGVGLVIYGRDGRIQSKECYSDDPHPSAPEIDAYWH